ncbi:hypothetical protein [uncultured Pedobacter sp.]|uniref:lipopolysaccharide biosynthesis protein n=1 Tax=uncultured Pedobacter sp. TaxID=246139 RepID=UPI0025DD94C5|nr:hypothetical protein [uncultured Pedobacter sp.]
MFSILSIKTRLASIKNGLGGRTKAVVYGSGLMALGTLISTITRVVLIGILARIYTKDQFGMWVAITSATAVMATSDFGLGSSLKNKLAELRAKGNAADDEAREYFLSVFYFFLVVATVISLSLIFFRNQIPYGEMFKTADRSLKIEGRNILIAVQIIFLYGIPLSIGCPMFFAYGESKYVAFQSICIGILSLVVIAALAFFHSSVTVTAITFFLISILVNTTGTIHFLIKRKWNILDVKAKFIWIKVKSLLILSLTFAAFQIAGAFIYNATTLIATANLSLANGAEINLVQKLYTFLITIYLSFYNPIWAGFAEAINEKQWEWCRKALTRIIQFTSLVFISGALCFTFFGNFFLQTLAGKGYVSNQYLFLSMGLWALFYSLYSMGSAFLSALGKVKLITFSTGVFALIYISLGNWSSKVYGINGISIVSCSIFFILAVVTFWQAFFLLKKRIAAQA